MCTADLLFAVSVTRQCIHTYQAARVAGVQVSGAVLLLVYVLGWRAVTAGLAAMLAMTPPGVYMARKATTVRELLTEATDARLKLTSEVHAHQGLL